MIDKTKARAAVTALLQKGRVTQEGARALSTTVENDATFASIVLKEYGPEVGKRYLAEEFIEHLEYYGGKLPLDIISVPEFMLAKDRVKEPWHGQHPVRFLDPKWWAEEAAEPWHSSLRLKIEPDPDASRWFNLNPKYFDDSVRMLTIVYQNEGNAPRIV